MGGIRLPVSSRGEPQNARLKVASTRKQARWRAVKSSSVLEAEKTTAIRSASNPPAMPPSVPAPVMRPKTCFAVCGSKDSAMSDQKPDNRIAASA